MEMKHKCNYCDALLSETNSVFVHISRYDGKGRSTRSLWMCCKCWDNTIITHAEKVTPDDIKKLDNTDSSDISCGNCEHLIFKDYKERCGQCRLTRLYRRFSDICLHEEEMS